MKDKLIFNRSSYLVSWPVLVVSPLLRVRAAFVDQRELAAVLIFLFLLAAVSRLWAFATVRKLSISVDSSLKGLFPGDTTALEITVRNEKFLPVVWLELFFPLSEDLCLTLSAGIYPGPSVWLVLGPVLGLSCSLCRHHPLYD